MKQSNKPLWIGIACILALQLVLVGNQFLSLPSMVYIDSNKLLENYEGMKYARSEFQSKAQAWQANIDTLTSEVKRTIGDYEKSSASMSKKEKELSQQLIKTKQEQLYNYQQAIQQQSAQEDAEMTEQVLTKVNAFLADYGKQKNYKIILGATNMGNIVYAEDALDITEEVLAELNKNYRGS